MSICRTDATLSQIKNQNITSRGKPKVMGAIMARRMEKALGLAQGWMDNEQAPASYRQQRIEQVLRVMETMPEYQLDKVVKIIDTLAEPDKNGAAD